MTTINLPIRYSEILRIRVVGADLIFVSKSGKEYKIPNGAALAKKDIPFLVQFSDGPIDGVDLYIQAVAAELNGSRRVS